MIHLLTWNALASFAALPFLEVVLSVDNSLFVAIAAGRLPPQNRRTGRQLGLTGSVDYSKRLEKRQQIIHDVR